MAMVRLIIVLNTYYLYISVIANDRLLLSTWCVTINNPSHQSRDIYSGEFEQIDFRNKGFAHGDRQALEICVHPRTHELYYPKMMQWTYRSGYYKYIVLFK